MANKIQESPKTEIIRIVALYSLFGVLWIYLSDSFIGFAISDSAVISRLSIYKGILFIALTAALLYFLIASYVKRISSNILELKQAQKKLQDKNNELESFTYTVSHDLKSPLITIQSYAGMIKKDLQAGNIARAEGDLSRIEGAAAKMTCLINDLLQLSRVGRMMNEPSDINMNRLVHDCLAQLTGSLELKKVSIVLQPDLPAVRGDAQRLSAVMQNLIENAIKYMGEQVTPRIEIGARVDGKETVFYVSDNGAGIDPLHHERVFGLFSKLDAGSAGTGIGLALVKRIIDIHRGRIWVESEGVGKGSRFCFTLSGGEA
ncbi:MAG: GHKL domain-containing protein [Geobacteraceae bacterium]|nr:GHKL domain-containing protein [Geobacteraceae bacterium]NTW78992.1 GHKL domain-containing protein [Geobacteraceae bacterium]